MIEIKFEQLMAFAYRTDRHTIGFCHASTYLSLFSLSTEIDLYYAGKVVGYLQAGLQLIMLNNNLSQQDKKLLTEQYESLNASYSIEILNQVIVQAREVTKRLETP